MSAEKVFHASGGARLAAYDADAGCAEAGQAPAHTQTITEAPEIERPDRNGVPLCIGTLHSSKDNVEARARAIKRNGLSLVAIHHPLLRAGRRRLKRSVWCAIQSAICKLNSGKWRARQDSNLWPTAPEAVALSS